MTSLIDFANNSLISAVMLHYKFHGSEKSQILILNSTVRVDNNYHLGRKLKKTIMFWVPI